MKNLIKALIKYLEESNFKWINSVLNDINTPEKYDEKRINSYSEFFEEAKLFVESKDEEHRNKALKLISYWEE